MKLNIEYRRAMENTMWWQARLMRRHLLAIGRELESPFLWLLRKLNTIAIKCGTGE